MPKPTEDQVTRAANRIDRHVGQTVRARRLATGMSQERLAELIGVTFQQVQKYEKGVNRISCSRLYDIARAQEMQPGEYFPAISKGIKK